jgi:glutaconate CoA-transferase subunit A
VLTVNPSFRTITDPFGGETLVAVPAIHPDFALIHVNYADASGNAVILGDSHVDALMAKAASRTLITTEHILPPEELARYGRAVEILSIYTTAVAEAPWGAHPTGLVPSYRADAVHFRSYLEAARSPEAWERYQSAYLLGDVPAYLEALGGVRALSERISV